MQEAVPDDHVEGSLTSARDLAGAVARRTDELAETIALYEERIRAMEDAHQKEIDLLRDQQENFGRQSAREKRLKENVMTQALSRPAASTVVSASPLGPLGVGTGEIKWIVELEVKT